MLKRKIEVNYRRAFVKVDGLNKNCKCCAHRQWQEIRGCNGEDLGRCDWRCDVIGLQNSRKYSVAADHICDCFES